MDHGAVVDNIIRKAHWSDPLYNVPVQGYIDEKEFLYLMNSYRLCEDSISFRDAYGFSCENWNAKCSRFDPPLDKIYSFGEIKEVHLFCKKKCGMCIEDTI